MEPQGLPETTSSRLQLPLLHQLSNLVQCPSNTQWSCYLILFLLVHSFLTTSFNLWMLPFEREGQKQFARGSSWSNVENSTSWANRLEEFDPWTSSLLVMLVVTLENRWKHTVNGLMWVILSWTFGSIVGAFPIPWPGHISFRLMKSW